MPTGIYSVPFGETRKTDYGVIHTLYTVPGPPDTAVLREVVIFVNAGGDVVVNAVFPSGDFFPIARLTAVAGVNPTVAAFRFEMPLVSGTELQAANVSAGMTVVTWGAYAGGYHFTFT